MKAFFGINFFIVIFIEYWREDNLICNDGIQNTMIRHRFCEILQNLHFADSRKHNKRDKAFKMRPAIDHLNSKFSKVLSNDSGQSIDEHIMKFKDRIWNEAVHKIKTNKVWFQILVSLLE